MQYLVKMDELTEGGSKIRKIAKENINTKIDELITMVDELEWEGPSFDAFMVQYVDSAMKLYDVSDAVDKIGKFMEQASSAWTETEEETEKNLNRYNNDVDALISKVNKII